MSEVPDVAEELERKTLEHLELIVHALTTKRMTLQQADAALAALWAASSGLVARETMDYVAKLHNGIKARLDGAARPDGARFLADGKGNYVLLQRRVGHVTVSGMLGSKPIETTFDFGLDVQPYASAHDKLTQIEKRFTDGGFTRKL